MRRFPALISMFVCLQSQGRKTLGLAARLVNKRPEKREKYIFDGLISEWAENIGRKSRSNHALSARAVNICLWFRLGRMRVLWREWAELIGGTFLPAIWPIRPSS